MTNQSNQSASRRIITKILASILVLIFSLSFLPAKLLADEDSVQVNLEVTGCNDNTICDGFETFEKCPRDCPPPAVIGGGGGGGTILKDTTPPVVSNLKSEPSADSSLISWNTDEPSVAMLSWGKTTDYEEGSLSEVFYVNQHSTKIVNLLPDTDYYFKLEFKDAFGNGSKIEGQQFKTLPMATVILKPIPQIEPPANVTNLEASPQENTIILNWQNPEDKNFQAVRVLRSEKFYPSDPFDGEIIYEGAAQKITDEKIKKDVTYYYSVFSVDGQGNYSSGAIASAKVTPKPEAGKPPAVTPPKEEPFGEFPQALEVHPKIRELSILDFDFIQDGKKLSFVGDAVSINGNKNVKISLDYGKVPEVLKTIAITLRDPEDQNKIFSFLLRVNKDKTAYEATIAPLGKSGLYPMNITILDYKNQGLKKITGKILAAAALESVKNFNLKNYFKNIFSGPNNSSIIIAFLLLLILLIIAALIFKKFMDFVWRRRKPTYDVGLDKNE